MENIFFNELKKEVNNVIEKQKNIIKVVNYLDKILKGAGSSIETYCNCSINSTRNLIVGSNSFEEFKNLLQKIENEKICKFTIVTAEELKEEKKFNDTDCKGDPDYQIYKNMLDTAIQLNKNLYLLS